MTGIARTKARTASGIAVLTLAATLVTAGHGPAPGAPAAPGPVALHDGHDDHVGPIVPTGFQDRLAVGHLSEPTAVAFAPDGTAFIALKSGVIKVFEYDAATRQYESFADHNNFVDVALSDNVHNYWDRGLTGITLDPEFGTAGHNFVYVNYAYNRDPRDDPPVVPRWDQGFGGDYDGCPPEQEAQMPFPPDPAVDGCVVSTRVSRLAATPSPEGWVLSGAEEPLLESTCMQFQSHASGDVRIGPDGWLYASAGDGASFGLEDYGQAGNPCDDPTDEGGSLRAQDYRTMGNLADDPLGLGGSIHRIDPATGQAPDGSDSNAARLVTYGQRNPWRFAFRPGTSELWSADVGGSAWEEINRTDMGTFSAPVNLGWPCYEGGTGTSQRQPAWDALDKPLCEGLYAEGAGAVRKPYFSYQTRGSALTPDEHCNIATSSVSGLAFTQPASSYPAAYAGSLFFSDYARSCIWRMGKKPDGTPDPAKVFPFVQQANTPVALVSGPGGDLFYVDYGLDGNGVPSPQAGGLRRITYLDPSPTAVISVDGDNYGPQEREYSFSAAGSTDPEGQVLTYTWDLDGDGLFGDSTEEVPLPQTYDSPTNVIVSVKVTDVQGFTDVARLTVYPGNEAPVFTAVTPQDAPENSADSWVVGDLIAFSAQATDDAPLSDANYRWSVNVRHCPSVCHTHPLGDHPGQRVGEFTAPDHEHPSHLLLQVSVTDSRGLRVSAPSIELFPRTTPLAFDTVPSGLPLTVAASVGTTPFARTFIESSQFTVSAPPVQRRAGVTYAFRSWSDGGPASHPVKTPADTTSLVATYAAVEAELRVLTKPRKLKVIVDGRRVRSGWVDSFAVGSRVRVKAPREQVRKGVRYEFVRWSDGRPRSHRVRIGDEARTLKAVYRRVGPRA